MQEIIVAHSEVQMSVDKKLKFAYSTNREKTVNRESTLV